MDKFNSQDVPQIGRYLLIDAVMYGQLIDSMTDKDATAFHAAADIKNGIVGQLYGFNIMMRSRVGRYTGTGSVKAWETAGQLQIMQRLLHGTPTAYAGQRVKFSCVRI